MSSSRTFDPIKTMQIIIPSTNFAVDDITDLPVEFTNAFTKLTLPVGTTLIQFPLNKLGSFSIQILKTADGTDFTSLKAKLMASNVGGTDTDVWHTICDEVTLTTGATTILIPKSDAIQNAVPYAHIGINLVAAGGTCDVYLIGHGVESF